MDPSGRPPMIGRGICGATMSSAATVLLVVVAIVTSARILRFDFNFFLSRTDVQQIWLLDIHG